jgi:hypothetical protein
MLSCIRLAMLRLFSIVLALLAAGSAGAQSIALITQAVPLEAGAATARVGALEYRGGIALRSNDRRFGGLSDLHVSGDGTTLLAIGDRGHWVRMRLTYDRSGRLAGAEDGEIGALIDETGAPLRGRDADAEAMAMMPDGSILLAFERNHRLLHYPEAEPPFSKPPVAFPAPVGLEDAPDNGGIEALAHVGRGFLLAITERMSGGAGAVQGWVGRNGAWEPLAYIRNRSFQPTGAALLPNGDVAVLERHYSVADGVSIRLARLPRAEIAPRQRLQSRDIAKLSAPLTVDNFEGIAVRRGPAPKRETFVYLLSDDNFNPSQRTLLLMFALAE